MRVYCVYTYIHKRTTNPVCGQKQLPRGSTFKLSHSAWVEVRRVHGTWMRGGRVHRRSRAVSNPIWQNGKDRAGSPSWKVHEWPISCGEERRPSHVGSLPAWACVCKGWWDWASLMHPHADQEDAYGPWQPLCSCSLKEVNKRKMTHITGPARERHLDKENKVH